jgi:phosphopentomutase
MCKQFPSQSPDDMKHRALVIVLDSVGCGAAPDAADYGDAGANTLGHLFERIPGFSLPNLASLGLHAVLGLNPASMHPSAVHSKLTPHSAGKDTTTGHWELMGCILDEPFATFDAFPEDLVSSIEQAGGVSFIGNVPASGTEILKQLGERHVQSGCPILYTSADSVLQIAAHEKAFGLQRLWDLCATAREAIDAAGIPIGRVIARPFVGDDANTFARTPNRRDFSLTPPATALNRLQASDIRTIGVGKIHDIFAGSGLDESHPTKSNVDGMAAIDRLWSDSRPERHFILANLVDFDALFGHRRDPSGYADCLREFDRWLGNFLPKIGDQDLVILTADHGNDPYHTGTDHTREEVPMLAIGCDGAAAKDFADVAMSVERALIGE